MLLCGGRGVKTRNTSGVQTRRKRDGLVKRVGDILEYSRCWRTALCVSKQSSGEQHSERGVLPLSRAVRGATAV